jgi:hypothetical protein
MSIFNDNITNDLSRTEKIRCWFRDRILEQFAEYSLQYRDTSDHWKIFTDDYHITDLIYKDLANLWVNTYHRELVEMGVLSTRTDVRKKIGGNKFRVNIKLAIDEKILMDDDDLEVEVKDLKIDIFGEGIYEHIR